jgi:hypothetical protein
MDILSEVYEDEMLNDFYTKSKIFDVEDFIDLDIDIQDDLDDYFGELI